MTSAAGARRGARPGCLTASTGVGLVLVVAGALLLVAGLQARTGTGQAVLVCGAAVVWLFASQSFVANYLLRAHARPDDDGPTPSRGGGAVGGR